MHIVVTTFGSAGDVNPLLAIAASLRAGGADVTFVANPFYEPWVAATGCRFVGAGLHRDVFAALAAHPEYFDAPAGPLAIWKDLIAPSIRETFGVVHATVRAVRARAVVSHVLGYGGAWAAIAAGVRSVIVTTTTSTWLSRHHPMVFGNWRAGRRIQGALTCAVRGLGRVVAQRPLGRLAAEVGAPKVADIVRAADLNLGVWPEWFRPPAPDDPPRAHASGFVFDAPPAAGELAARVTAFLSDGAPPVVVGFGSAASLHATRRYRAIAAACRRLGRRCLLIGPSALPTTAPDRGVLAVERASFASAFAAASVIVHHGGFGTSAEALRAGRPSVVMPFAFDQFDNAARLSDLGLGRWLRGDADDPAPVAAALDAAVRDAPLADAARAAAARIAGDRDGATRAAELVLRCAAAAPPPSVARMTPMPSDPR